VFVTFSAKSFA